MPKKTFKKEDLVAILECEKVEGIEIVEESGWKDDGKHSYQEIIIKSEGKFYRIYNSRTGSYYSDFYYDYEDWENEIELREVEKIEVTKYEWEDIKEMEKKDA